MDFLINWDKIVGIILIAVGLVWIAMKCIQVSVEGREALFYIKGRLSSLFGFFMVIAGLLFLLGIVKID